MPAALATLLRGAWRLERRLEAADGAPMGLVQGASALFAAPEPPATPAEEAAAAAALGQGRPLLLYTEQGELALPAGGPRLGFTRSYLYCFTSDRSADVFFYKPGLSDHLKFFHSISLDAAGASTAEHLCVEDLYSVDLQVDRDDAFRMHWRVVGPAKDYHIFSRYEKEGAPASAAGGATGAAA